MSALAGAARLSGGGRAHFYRERLRGVREHVRTAADLPRLPFTTKEELREGQRREPPFGPHLCAPRERLVRMHVTSGTTGEPVAVGLTQRDHVANSRRRRRGVPDRRRCGPDDLVAHCLNYALYAGGIADHMALEASGATVVPVGVGQSQRLLELIPQLGITALFGTLSFPAYLAGRARGGHEPPSWACATSSPPASPARASPPCAREIETAWGATVADTFGMSDVWSTMGGECGEGEGLHLTRRRARGARAGRPGQRRAARRSRTARAASWCGPICARGVAAAALPLRRPRAGVDVAVRVRPQRRRASASTAAATTCCASRPSTSTRQAIGAIARHASRWAHASWPRATRSSRRCACTSRRRAGGPRRRRRAAAQPRCGARFDVDAAGSRDAARGRAQDPNRPPDRARGPAAAGGGDAEEGARRDDSHDRELGAARTITWDRQDRRNAWDVRHDDRHRRRDRGGGRRRGRAHRSCCAAPAATSRPATTCRRRSRPTRAAWAADDRRLPAPDPGRPGLPVPVDRRDRRRLRRRRARVRGVLRPAAVHRPRAAAHARGRHRPGGQQRRHALLPERARRDRPPASCCSAASRARRGVGRERGFATEIVAPASSTRASTHWAGVFSKPPRAPRSPPPRRCSTSASGPLLRRGDGPRDPARVRLFEEPDAKAALRGFAERRAR